MPVAIAENLPNSTPVPGSLTFASTHSVREAERLQFEADFRIQRTEPQDDYATLPQALQASQTVPQYRRIFVQGCACSTGIAGGGCCPGNAAGMAAGGGSHAMHGPVMGIMGGAAIGLGFYGQYSALKVWNNADEALTNIDHVAAGYVAPRLSEARLQRAQLVRYPQKLTQAEEATAHQVSALEGYQQDLKISRAEQQFNRAVPGVLQGVAATAVTLGGVNEIGMGIFGALGGAVLGAVGSGLFAVYGGVMAIKQAITYRQTSHLSPIVRSENLPDKYRRAANEHRDAKLKNLHDTGFAWAGVAVAGVFGTLVAAGLVAFPYAWVAVAVVALAAAGWAMWQNSRTRWVPHLPVSPHVQREDLVTPQQRAERWDKLRPLDKAIKKAVGQLEELQSRATRVRYTFERLFKPQCGPSAFQVLAQSVQSQRGDGNLTAAELQARYETIQLDALQAYVDGERNMLRATLKACSADIDFRIIEMKKLVDPCCAQMTADALAALAPGAPTEPVYTRASLDLRDDAAALEHASRKLSALSLLADTLPNLRAHTGNLSAPDDQPLTPAQQDWLFAREAVSRQFMDKHPQHFSRSNAAHALPINNLYVLPERQADFAQDIAATLDGAFVHAFFNPRRIEAEMDFIVEREWTAREKKKGAAGAVAPSAPQCDSGTCCR
jgi:hypothetical protein